MFERYRRVGIFILWLVAAAFFLYEFFLRTFVGTLASQIIPSLHLNMESFAWVEVSYTFAYGLMQVPAGLITDRCGALRSLLFGVLICGVATLLFSQSQNLAMAMLARLLMGFGSAFGFVCLISIVVKYFPHRHFAFMAGISQFIGTIGPMLAGGPLVNLLEHNQGQWRLSLFYISIIAFVLAVCIIALWRIRPKTETINNNQTPKPHLSLYTQLRMLCSNRQIWFIACYSGAIYISLALMGAVWGTSFLQSKGLLQMNAAYVISAAWLGYAIGCPVLGVISDWYRRRNYLLFGCALLGLITAIAIIFSGTKQYSVYLCLFFMLGVAGSGQNIAIIAMVENASKQLRSTVIGLNNAIITVFTTTVPPLVGLLINTAAHGQAVKLDPNDFVSGLIAMPLFFALALILAWFGIRETHAKTIATALTGQLYGRK